ncbi:uncharacterized protein LOC116254741 isoform X1 [Nymphaea colorata]|nr:uncharacterized protein LOC116254741 isoform X1 [Nymphaea colorata]XP_031486150.1 uncharacterized protein LOC116254741 isoform X1 [Nymphaea colorata]
METLSRLVSQLARQSHTGSSTEGQMEAFCALCRRAFTEDNEMMEGHKPMSLCHDCRAVFVEDFDPDVHWTRHHRRRSRHQSSGSVRDLLSQQFSQLINRVRQNLHGLSAFGVEDGYGQDTDTVSTVLADAAPHTDVDSIFGGSDTNASISGYGAFPGDIDAVSFNGYGLNSDAFFDEQSLVDREVFLHGDDHSHIDSDTDIDPMHAGLDNWNSNCEEDEDDEEGDWIAADAELEAVWGTNGWVHLDTRTSEGNEHAHLHQGGPPLENHHRNLWRRDDSTHNLAHYRHAYISDTFLDFENTNALTFVGNSDDYLDERGFEELFDHLAETENLTRGAPPAAQSVINSLPRVIIGEAHEEHGIVICAVCKDPLVNGTEANQLPCMHLYHPSCVLPWLSTRNTCPVCRYELLTDDKDYEEGKRITRIGMPVHELQQMDSSEDSSSDSSDDLDVDERNSLLWQPHVDGLIIADDDEQIGSEVIGPGVERTNVTDNIFMSDGFVTDRPSRRGWLILAAAPIVSILGMVLVLWFGDPFSEGRLNRIIRLNGCISEQDLQQLN